MSGNADFAIAQNLCSWGRMSVAMAPGLTRSVAWLTNSGAKYSNTAS
jgi:hypothetical protein